MHLLYHKVLLFTDSHLVAPSVWQILYLFSVITLPFICKIFLLFPSHHIWSSILKLLTLFLKSHCILYISTFFYFFKNLRILYDQIPYKFPVISLYLFYRKFILFHDNYPASSVQKVSFLFSVITQPLLNKNFWLFLSHLVACFISYFV